MVRLWTIADIARTFHKLPSEVIADLDNDPDLSAIKCLDLIRYAEAKGRFDASKGDDKQLEAWRGSVTMDRVEENTFYLFKERRKRRQEANAIQDGKTL